MDEKRKNKIWQDMTKAIKACDVPAFHKACVQWCAAFSTDDELLYMAKSKKEGEICHKKPPQVTPS